MVHLKSFLFFQRVTLYTAFIGARVSISLLSAFLTIATLTFLFIIVVIVDIVVIAVSICIAVKVILTLLVSVLVSKVGTVASQIVLNGHTCGLELLLLLLA